MMDRERIERVARKIARVHMDEQEGMVMAVVDGIEWALSHTKTETAGGKPILDACCGGKMFYFDKNDSRVLFQDIRKVKTTLCDGRPFEVNPDVQADFTDMPYEDDSFSMVVFDPPHLEYTGSQKESKGYQMIKYGSLSKDWREMLTKGFAECFRVLKPGGFLIFKWNETDIKVSEILKLTPEKPIFGHISGKRSNTHWICFMKEEKK